MLTTQNPFCEKAIDIQMHVGSDNYTVPKMLREYKTWGASKRIPMTGVPIERLIPGVSRMFLWHSEAIPLVKAAGKSFTDLVAFLVEKGWLSEETAQILELDRPWHPEEILLPSSYVPLNILRITCIIQDLDPKDRREVEKEFQVKWQGAVVAWAYIEVQYVVKDPEKAQAVYEKYGDLVHYVQIEYDREWKNEPEKEA